MPSLLSLESATDAEITEAAERAAGVLREGGLVVFPTETVYGVAASAASDTGIARLRELRGVESTAAFTVHLASPDDAAKYADLSHPHLSRLVHKAMPGPITLRVAVDEDTARDRLEALGLDAEAADRIYEGGVSGEVAGETVGGMVGLRCPDDPLALALLEAADGPVVAASAGAVGGRAALTARDARDAMGDRVDLILDGGRTRYAKGSTVVRVDVARGAGDGPDAVKLEVEREGVFDERTLRRLTRYTLLLVCSGNTCRSPMAEGIAASLLAKSRGLEPGELEAAGVRVVSAGVFAAGGAAASGDAVRALAEEGIDLSQHRSRPLSPTLLQEADRVYTMTRAHLDAILAAAPWTRTPVERLDPDADIEDPIGTDLPSYQSTAATIRQAVERRLREIAMI